MVSPSISSKKRASLSKQKASKKPRPLASGSLSPSDMQRFWGLEQKHMYDNFKSRPIVPGRVINLSQLKDSHCPKNDELKTRLLGVEHGFETLHDVVEKVFRLQKDTTTDIGKLRIAMTGI
uniref:Uncharacterized protein n=1 Tax=Solanum tuberosum TaxID=4113 RepID=M1D9P8_SOLTU